MSELKRCPFCGGEAKYESGVHITPAYDGNGAYVDIVDAIYSEQTGCPACDIWFYSGYDYNHEEPEEITIERWNRRATDVDIEHVAYDDAQMGREK